MDNDHEAQEPPAPLEEGTSEVRPAFAVVVLLCKDLQALGNGLDLEELRHWIEQRDANVQAKVVPALCHSPDEPAHSAENGDQRIVLGLCSSDYAELEMHSKARRVGLDPLGVEVVDLGTLCTRVPVRGLGMEKAKLLLFAAVARVRVYPGSSPESLKTYFSPLSQRVSRRALFTLPPVRYQAVASIVRERCAAEEGCTLCAQACPRGAIKGGEGGLRVDKSQCDPCGLCVVACPRDAILIPDCSSVQLNAQVNALLDEYQGPLSERRILFTCRRGIQAIGETESKGIATSPYWLPVQMPCAGMVSVSCILECLTRGAAVVGVLPCDGDCPFGQREAWEGRVAYCQELLSLLGDSPKRVMLLSMANEEGESDWDSRPTPGSFTGGQKVRDGLFGPDISAGVLRQMAEDYGASPELSMEHPYSPFGLVQLQADKCTGCGVCASSCPSGALVFEQEETNISLSFDATLCTGCGECVPHCPESREHVIQVHRITDLRRLAQGRVVLFLGEYLLCPGCGTPIAPRAIIERVERILERGSTPVPTTHLRYCVSCRTPSILEGSSQGR